MAVGVDFGKGHRYNKGFADEYHGSYLGWFYQMAPIPGTGSTDYILIARHSRTWTATCKKTIRRTRK